jgi:DnaK suppressor protein
MLKTQRKRYFRNLLHQKLDEMATKTGGARMSWDIKGIRFPDLVDRATAEQERDIELRIIERHTALRTEVMFALEKIKDGTYGVCESCEKEIESERLDAMPFTSLCIECKRREEAKQRVKRTANLRA